MSDSVAVFLILLALAAVGNFAGAPEAFSGNCAGQWLQFCW